MLILALETSTEAGSCALWHAGSVLERACPAGRSHSETLLPLVRELLAEAGVAFAQLDAIAFGAGPGAFTGLRVACAAAQGLAVALGRPVLPVGSLESMAAAACASELILPQAAQPRSVLSLLDARMGELYAGFFAVDRDNVSPLGELSVGRPESLIFPAGQDWCAVGNALRAYPELAERLQGCGVRGDPGVGPSAAWVARLAAPCYLRGEAIDPALAAPRYVRNKVAQTVAERVQAGGKA